jgi:hypothetical protein
MSSYLLFKDEPFVAYYPKLAVELKSSLKALFVQQLHYWVELKGKLREGYRWVYHSAMDWHKYFPELSLRTVKTLLSELARDGWIFTGSFNTLKWDRTKWYRVNYAQLKAAFQPAPIVQKLHHGECSNCTVESAVIAPTIPEILIKSSLEINTASKLAEGTPIMAGTKELLEKIKNKQPESLEGLWKKRMGMYQDGFQKKLTGKETGQLSQFCKSVGADARSALDYALCNWSKFAMEVKALKGLPTCPQIPVLGFLLAHHDVLMQLIAEPAKVAVKSTGPSMPTVILPQEETAIVAVFTPEEIAEGMKEILGGGG